MLRTGASSLPPSTYLAWGLAATRIPEFPSPCAEILKPDAPSACSSGGKCPDVTSRMITFFTHMPSSLGCLHQRFWKGTFFLKCFSAAIPKLCFSFSPLPALLFVGSVWLLVYIVIIAPVTSRGINGTQFFVARTSK